MSRVLRVVAEQLSMAPTADVPGWVTQARAELPVTARSVYLNTGTAGPVPLVSVRASEQAAEADLVGGRGNFSSFAPLMERRDLARDLCARVLGAGADEVALTHHTSEGIHIVLTGIDWRPGDRVITTSLEHDAVAVPLGLLRERFGVEVVFVDIGLGETAVPALERALEPGARLVLLSHVTYSSGAVLPVAQLAEIGQRAGAMVLVDGAQSCGAMPVDVKALGVDFYTLSGQKWLCGPEGTGALFVRRDRIDRIRPIQASYFSARTHDFAGHVELHPDARRYETGMVHRPALAAFVASVQWILDGVGVQSAWARSLELARVCRDRLSRIDGVALVTPETMQGHLVTLGLPGRSPAELRDVARQLAGAGIVVRSIDHPPHGVRASLGFFNTHEEVERFCAAIEGIVRLLF